MRPAFDVSRFHLMKAKGESMQTSIRSRFSLRLCCILSAVLALSICVPGGAIQALASDGGAQATTSSTASPEPAAGQAADESQSPSAVSQEQSEQAGAADPDKSAEAASASADEGTSPDGSQANETRGSPVASTPAALRSSLLRAPSAAKQVDTSITGLQILDPGKKSTTELTYSSGFYLDMKWQTKPGEIVHAGDYFDVTIPDTVNLNRLETVKGFDLTNADRVVQAYATVTPAANGGGTVRVVFNDKVDGKYNVKGSLSLYAFFNQKKVKENTTVPIQLEVNGQTSEVPSSPSVGVKPNPPIDETLGKWGEKTTAPNVVRWKMRINQKKLNLDNLVINDSLTSGNGTVIQNDSKRPIQLEEGTYDEAANFTKVRDVDLSDKMTVLSDTSFRLNLGDSGTKQYLLTYYTTKTSGDSQMNHADLKAGNVQLASVNIPYKEKGGGGTADGDLANKIKITKVDADTSVALAGAVFTVTRPNDPTFKLTLTTGPDGTVTSDSLEQGTYKVKEKTAPAGYERNDKEYTLEVTPTGGALETIKDEPVKTTVKVYKKWVGPEGDAVTVRLLADGADTGKTRTLNKAGSWEGTFENLRKYKPGTYTEIVYMVSEDPVDNYSSDVSGDAAAGFTVTNTNTETVDVSGTKTWDDANNQDGVRPESITVNLLANGVQKDSRTVKASDNWEYSFTGLPKYGGNGEKVTYTVTENQVDGYSTAVSGTDITNTHTPGQTSVTVSKAWDDADDQDGIRPASVKVQLYADGQPYGDAVELGGDNQWSHTWTGLAQKSGGSDVAYTVQEVGSANGYASSVSGSAPEGFTVTNSHTPETINIPVTKKWVGPEGDSATVRLYAGGADTGKALTLDKAGSWAGEFTDLPKFKGGREIAYTVKEDAVPDYSSAVSGDAVAGFTVTNTLNKGTFSVKKVVAGATFDGAANTFNVQYRCTPASPSVHLTDEQKAGSLTLEGNGAAVTSPSLPFGTSCTIKEADGSAQRAGYAVATAYTAGEVKVGTATPSPEVTVTNKYAPLKGGFVISKTVDGDGAALAKDKEFTFDYTCTPLTGAAQVKGTVVVKGGENGAVTDVPVGSCSVSERDATIDGASLNTVLTVDGSSDGVNNGRAVFNVKDGVTVKVAATNTYVLDRGSFSVAKKVVGGADSFTKDTFVFDYVCTDGTEGRLDVPGDGTAVEGPRVPTGTECTVTERAQTANRDGYTVTSELSDNGKVTISQKDAVVAVTATNTYTPVPKVPSKQLAKTGASNVAVVGVVGSLLVVVGGVLIALKRRRHDA